MVAVVRHLNAEAFGCLDEIKAVFDRDRAAIDVGMGSSKQVMSDESSNH